MEEGGEGEGGRRRAEEATALITQICPSAGEGESVHQSVRQSAIDVLVP